MNYKEIFSEQEIQEFKSKGYNEQDIQNAVNEAKTSSDPLMDSYSKVQKSKINDPRASASNSFIASSYHDNLIQWQLELDSILERIEHMLRGDKPVYENGSVIWKSPSEVYLLRDNKVTINLNEDEEKICDLLNSKYGLTFEKIQEKTQFKEKELQETLFNLIFKKVIEKDDGTILNDFGISELMRILSNYINRNTILSNYDEDTIREKLYDLGNELTDLIYLKYERMGLKDLEKRKLYPIIVREMVDIVHSSYLRALNGGERESLREARQVSQSETVMPQGVNIYAGNQQRERGLLNPLRYLAGKNK